MAKQIDYTQFLAKFLTNDFIGILREKKLTLEDCPLPPHLASPIIHAIYSGQITRQTGKELLGELIDVFAT